MSRSQIDILTAARARITPPSSWAKDTYARNAEGTPVNVLAPSACSWCVIGAVAVALNQEPTPGLNGPFEDIWQMLRTKAYQLHRVGGPTAINDDRGHEDILGFLDEVIASLKDAPAHA